MRNLDSSIPAAGVSSPPGPAAQNSPPGIPGPVVLQAETKRTQGTGRDGLVLLSIAIVSVALATMFYTQLSMPLSTSSLYGAGAWAAFMLVHKLVQKSAQVTHLRAELARSRGQSVRPRNLVRAQPATPLETAAITTIDVRAPDAGASAPKVETVDIGLAAAASSSDGSSSDFGLRRPVVGDTEMLSQASVADTIATSLASMPMPAPPAFAGSPSDTEPAQSPDRPAEALRDQWSLRPRQDARAAQSEKSNPAGLQPDRPASSLTIEGDLDLVLRKIKELADDVNAGDTLRSAPSLRPEPQLKSKAAAIEDSIGALKSAATTMRERALSDYIPAREAGNAQRPVQHDTTLRHGLGDLVIPSTAERIAGPVDRAYDHLSAGGRREPVLPDLPMPNFSSNPHSGAALTSAIDSGAMSVTLAPIVALASHSVGHYEMSLNLKVSGGEMLEASEQTLAKLHPDVRARCDIARLNRAASLALRMETRDKDGALLTTFMGSSFASRSFLEALAGAYEARHRIAAQLVPVLSQRSVEAFTPSVWQAVRDMHAFGFRFALDGVSNVAADFSMLALAGFRFVRLDARVLLEGAMSADRFVTPNEIRQRIALAGLAVISSGVNDARLQAKLLDAGIALGQGSLFGTPRDVNLKADGKAQRSAA